MTKILTSFNPANRSFKEWATDSFTASFPGCIVLLPLIIIIIPVFYLYLIIGGLYHHLRGLDSPEPLPTDLRLITKNVRLSPVNIYNELYYSELKRKYSYNDEELYDLEKFCVLESVPDSPMLLGKVFTYPMAEFADGALLHEIDMKGGGKSWLIYFEPQNERYEILREFDKIYDLKFEKINENKMRVWLRYTGEKCEVIVTRKPN